MAEWFERTFVPEETPSWMKSSRENKASESTKQNEAQQGQLMQAEADKAAAEQKALQDAQEETKTKASTRLAASTAGFSGKSNTARSFLTTF
jgi:hypothetical protein